MESKKFYNRKGKQPTKKFYNRKGKQSTKKFYNRKGKQSTKKFYNRKETQSELLTKPSKFWIFSLKKNARSKRDKSLEKKGVRENHLRGHLGFADEIDSKRECDA